MPDIKELSQSFANTFKADIQTADCLPKVEVFPTGLRSIDFHLSDCGGIPIGRAAEGHGFESSGKSTFGHFLAASGKRHNPDFKVLWLDAEGAFVGSWAQRLGQDLSQTLVPDNLVFAEDYIRALKWGIVNLFDLIVLDCLASLVPRSVGDRLLKKDKYGNVREDGSLDDERQLKMNESLAKAKLFSQVLMPDLMSGFRWDDGNTYRLSQSSSFVYLINQLRSGVDTSGMVNVDNVTPGGQAIKHLVSIRWQFTKKGVSKERDATGAPLYQIIQIRNVKNKVGTPFKETTLTLDLADGTFKELDAAVIKIAVQKGVVEEFGGGYYKVAGNPTKLHGGQAVVEYLTEHPDLWDKVYGTGEDFNNVESPTMTYSGESTIKKSVQSSDTIRKILMGNK